MKAARWMAALVVAASTAARGEPAAVPEELARPEYLYALTQHLYRWHMDEADVENEAQTKTLTFWIRRVDAELDEGDRSELAEIALPKLGIAARVKKSDYLLEELGVEIKSGGFRIVNVQRPEMPEEAPPGTVEVEVDYRAMKEHLFRTRDQAEYPDEAMRERLRRAAREHLGLDPDARGAGAGAVYVAPLSPVANEVWAFAEGPKALARFSADVDLENPAVWEHQTLTVDVYEIMKQTVVSMEEAAGSNEFLTRDQVGRALFNCVVLGKRLEPAGSEE